MQRIIDDRIIREAECFDITGLSRSTRWRMERAGTFPKRRQLGENSVGWLLSEVVDCVDSRSKGMLEKRRC